MPGVNLGSLLAAAIVSAAVALGVEWLAKPRLEARKERILAAATMKSAQTRRGRRAMEQLHHRC